jgi:hypothetical protein
MAAKLLKNRCEFSERAEGGRTTLLSGIEPDADQRCNRNHPKNAV